VTKVFGVGPGHGYVCRYGPASEGIYVMALRSFGPGKRNEEFIKKHGPQRKIRISIRSPDMMSFASLPRH
jgi:hypothetical protein